MVGEKGEALLSLDIDSNVAKLMRPPSAADLLAYVHACLPANYTVLNFICFQTKPKLKVNNKFGRDMKLTYRISVN